MEFDRFYLLVIASGIIGTSSLTGAFTLHFKPWWLMRKMIFWHLAEALVLVGGLDQFPKRKKLSVQIWWLRNCTFSRGLPDKKAYLKGWGEPKWTNQQNLDSDIVAGNCSQKHLWEQYSLLRIEIFFGILVEGCNWILLNSWTLWKISGLQFVG